MDTDANGQDEPPARESHLADLSLVPLAELFASRQDVLAAAVRRAVGEVERSARAISGWSSYIDVTGPAPVAATATAPESSAVDTVS